MSGSGLARLRLCLHRPLPPGEAERHRLVARISLREQRSRIPLFVLVAVPAMALTAGFWPALAALLLVAGSEAAEQVHLSRLARPEAPVREGGRLLMYALSVASAAGYVLPGLLLAAHASPPVAMIGLLWITGMTIHVATQYVAVRFICLSSLVIACAALLAAAVLVGLSPARPATLPEMAAGLAMSLVFILHLWGMLLGVRETQEALDRVQDAERARLAALSHDIAHDRLTGLANREEFERVLAGHLARDPARVGSAALLLLDLDGFKAVNDSYGHAAGDAILRATGDRLRGVLREGATAARLGGDEFAVILTGIAARAEAEAIARRLAAELPLKVAHGGAQLSVGVSIGIALQRDVRGTATDLIAAADQAMYRAKRLGQNGWMVYEPGPAPRRPADREREELAEALRARAIVPHYQPKIELASGRIAGFEALARWRHPERGLLLPAAFLPAVIEHGLAAELTFGIARQVLGDVTRWRADGLDPGRVSLNVTEGTLATRSGLEDFEWLIAEFPGTAPHFAIEVTEGVTLARSAALIRAHVDRLSALGVRVAMDDFGRGFASFQHLRHFTFHELKIDGEFVQAIDRDPSAAVIVEGFLAIARGLGAETVAEGVETPAQAAALRQRGCTYGQGFLFGGAVDAEAAADLLRAEPARLPVPGAPGRRAAG